MLEEKDIIVAIELGSSAIRGIAGQKGPDGNMKILAIEQENVKECVRRGIIFNIDKTTRAIRLIKDRLEEKLNLNITRAYVGLSGLSLHTVPNKILHELGQYIKITGNHIDDLMDENHRTQYSKRVILETVPQEYSVDGNRTNEPEGIQGSQLEGKFLNIIALTSLKDNITKCLREAGLLMADLLISPVELAKHLVPDSEKRSGCVLMDMGAETTSVSIYSDNLLRHLVVIPLGGKNITKDICNICNVGVEEAENLKKKNTVAYVKTSEEEENSRDIVLSGDRLYSESKLQEIVSARTEEIIRNVWTQIESSTWKDKLLSGIILTGGASTHAKMTDAFRTVTQFDKVKAARSLMESTSAEAGVGTNDDITINTLIALLLSGTQPCATEKTVGGAEEPAHVEEEQPRVSDTPRRIEDTPAQTPTRNRTRVEDDFIDEEEQEPKPKRKKSNWFERFKNGINEIVSDDEED